MPRRRKTKGGAASWSEWFQENNPLASKPAAAPVISQTPPPPPAPLPEPLAAAVTESQGMAQTAGRRIQKHTGYNPASSKSMRKLFGTAKGDTMLGGKRRRRRTHRRR